MSRYFAITTGTSTVQVKNNRSGSVTFTVTNNADEGIRTRARITALSGDEAWFAIDGDKEREYREKTQQYTVNFTLPATAAPGAYTFRMDVFAVENPDEIYSEGPVVQIDVTGAEAPPAKPSGFPWWIVAVVAAVLLIGAGIVIWATWKRTEVVPMVKLKPLAEAEQTLLDLKFKVEKTMVLTVKSDEVDVVIGQDPPPETEVAQGSTVTLTVGQEGVEVPPILGSTIENALEKITAAGLTCRIGASEEVKKKIDDQQKTAASPPSPAPSPTPEVSPGGIRMMTMVPMIFRFTPPKVTDCEPDPGTVVKKNAIITIYTGNSSRTDFIELKKADLKAIGIRADVLKNYAH